MPGVDTNLLVRWLIDDDERQASLVQTLLESAHVRPTALFVPNTVTLELEWVLRSRYRLDKADILAAFNALLETQEIDVQDEAALERALHHYRNGAAEFADCMHSRHMRCSQSFAAADVRQDRCTAARRRIAGGVGKLPATPDERGSGDIGDRVRMSWSPPEFSASLRAAHPLVNCVTDSPLAEFEHSILDRTNNYTPDRLGILRGVADKDCVRGVSHVPNTLRP